MKLSTAKIIVIFITVMTMIYIFTFSYFLYDEPESDTLIKLNHAFHQHQDGATQSQKEAFYYLSAIEYQIDNNIDIEASSSKNINQTSAEIEKEQLISIGYLLIEKSIKIDNNPILTESEQIEQKNNLDVDYPVIESPEKKGLFCSLRTSKYDCVKTIFEHSKEWKTTLNTADNPTILRRYQQFLSNEPAINQLVFNSTMLTPKYQNLMIGQRLRILALLEKAKHGDKKVVLNEMLTDFSRLRIHWAQTDTLISRLIMNSLLSNQLQAMAWLKTHYAQDQLLLSTPIEALSPDERSMATNMISEHQIQDYTFKHLLDLTEQSENKSSLFNSILNSGQKLYYKPNKTRNQCAKDFQHLIEQDKVAPDEFARMVQAGTSYSVDVSDVGYDMFKDSNNSIGKILNRIAMFDFTRYKKRILAIDNQINMVNYLLSNGQEALYNGYSPVVTEITKTDDKICMTSPQYEEPSVVHNEKSVEETIEESAKSDNNEENNAMADKTEDCIYLANF